MTFKAFISYSHDIDADFISSFHRSLETFGKKWYKTRKIKIYRDKTYQEISVSLWSSLKKAISDSEYFIYLASPTSAKSEWVLKEIRFWIENKNIENIVIVLIDGNISWHDNNKEFISDNVMPDVLKKEYNSEPLYVDFRSIYHDFNISNIDNEYYEGVASISSFLLNKSKEELFGYNYRQLKRKKLFIKSLSISILVLILVIFFSFHLYINKKNESELISLKSDLRKSYDFVNNGEFVKARLKLSNIIERSKDKKISESALIVLDTLKKSKISSIYSFDSELYGSVFISDSKFISWGSFGVVITDSKDNSKYHIHKNAAMQTYKKNSPQYNYKNKYFIYLTTKNKIVILNIKDKSIVNTIDNVQNFVVQDNLIATYDDYFIDIYKINGQYDIPLVTHNENIVSGIRIINSKNQYLIWGERLLKIKSIKDSSLQSSFSLNDTLTTEEDLFQTNPAHSSITGVIYENDRLVNDKIILTWGTDHKIRLWSLIEKDNIRSFSHDVNSRINNVVLYKDQSRFVSYDDRGKAIIWDINSGEKLHILEHNSFVSDSILLDGGNKILTQSGNNVYLWDLETGKKIDEYINNSEITKMSIKDKKLLISHKNNTVNIWDFEKNKFKPVVLNNLQGVIQMHKPSVNNIITLHKEITSIDIKTNSINWKVNNDDAHLLADFDNTSNRMITCVRNNVLNMYNTLSGKIIKKIDFDSDIVRCYFSNDYNKILIWLQDNTFRVIDSRTSALLNTIKPSKGYIGHTIPQKDNKFVFIKVNSNNYCIFNYLNSKKINCFSFSKDETPINSNIIYSKNKVIFWNNKELSVYSLDNNNILFSINYKKIYGDSYNNYIRDASLLKKSETILWSITEKGWLSFWDLTENKEVSRISFDKNLTKYNFSSDSNFILLNTFNKFSIWDVKMGYMIKEYNINGVDQSILSRDSSNIIFWNKNDKKLKKIDLNSYKGIPKECIALETVVATGFYLDKFDILRSVSYEDWLHLNKKYILFNSKKTTNNSTICSIKANK